MLLRGGDERVAPLVCVHPPSGLAEDYRALAAALTWPGPIVGIDAPDADFASLAELANGYVETLDLQKPALLLGWAIGGVIAAEMSRVVVARGGSVRFLGLLDARAPQPEMRQRPTDRASIARAYVMYRALLCEREPVPAPASSDASALLATLRQIGADAGIADEHELERRLRTVMRLMRAFFLHDQQPVPVTIHLFESSDEHPAHPKPPTLGWEALTPHLERHFVGGTHYTLLAPRYIEALARTINSCL